MGHLLNIELNLTHFNTNPKILLALWKDLADLFHKQLEVLKKYFLVKLCDKEIYGPCGTNISLPPRMGICMYI